MKTRSLLGAALAGSLFVAPARSDVPADVGPHYDFDRRQLEAVLEDMKAWLPGSWDSFPQIWYERNVTMPEEGEHEHWHRTFALIDAPQVGETVFYGQINVGGRDGPIMPRTQVLYKAVIDEERGVVSINGQPIPEPDRFQNLHERPGLWREVRMRDEAALHCSFIWRRDGVQLFGILEGKNPEWSKYGTGTCNYVSGSGAEFYADAEWVLSPDELWLYDINTIAGVQFIGRKDRTHIRLYRALPYACALRTGEGPITNVTGHDRGLTARFTSPDGRELEVLLLRNHYPPAEGPGLVDELRLMISDAATGETQATSAAAPKAERIALEGVGVSVTCQRADAFPPMAIRD